MGTRPDAISLPADMPFGTSPSLAVENNSKSGLNHPVVYVAWRSVGIDDERIHVRRWTNGAWEGSASDPMIAGLVRRTDGLMGAPTVVTPAGQWNSNRPVHVLWGETGLPDGSFRLRAASLDVRSTPSEAATLVDETRPVVAPTVRLDAPAAGADRAGNALVVYDHPVASTGLSEPRSLRWLARGQRWYAPSWGAAQGAPIRAWPAVAVAGETGGAWALGFALPSTSSNAQLFMRPFD